MILLTGPMLDIVIPSCVKAKHSRLSFADLVQVSLPSNYSWLEFLMATNVNYSVEKINIYFFKPKQLNKMILFIVDRWDYTRYTSVILFQQGPVWFDALK